MLANLLVVASLMQQIQTELILFFVLEERRIYQAVPCSDYPEGWGGGVRTGGGEWDSLCRYFQRFTFIVSRHAEYIWCFCMYLHIICILFSKRFAVAPKQMKMGG